MVVFGLEDRNKKRVFVVNNVPSSLGEEAFVDSVEISDSQSSIFFTLVDVLPRTKNNRISGVVSWTPAHQNRRITLQKRTVDM